MLTLTQVAIKLLEVHELGPYKTAKRYGVSNDWLKHVRNGHQPRADLIQRISEDLSGVQLISDDLKAFMQNPPPGEPDSGESLAET